MVEKVIRKYIPYKNGKWDQEVLDKIKEETGFNPPPQNDEVDFSTREFVIGFMTNIPPKKIVNVDSYNSNELRVSVTEFIETDK
jgi:hypothetical protein